jgi:hypothetical protein
VSGRTPPARERASRTCVCRRAASSCATQSCASAAESVLGVTPAAALRIAVDTSACVGAMISWRSQSTRAPHLRHGLPLRRPRLQAGQAPQTTWVTLAAAAAGRRVGRFARGWLARARDSSALSPPRALDFPDAHADDIRTFFGSDGKVAERALCLGLGNPSSSGPARAQLALLLSVCDALQIVSSKYAVLRVVLTITKDHAHVSLYDPVFSAADHDLLGSLGTHVLPAEQVPSPSPNCTRRSI